ncbi:unnamed protein product, partial [Rotaria sp. Silwood1]
MILVLDNASYHHAHGPDYIDPYKMNKAEVVEKLLSYNIDSIEVEREGKVRMDSSTFNKHGGSRAPTLLELQTALTSHLQNIGYLAEDTEKFSKSSSILVTGERSLSGSTMKPVKLDLSNIKRWNSDAEI